jgi:hypothetical protein
MPITTEQKTRVLLAVLLLVATAWACGESQSPTQRISVTGPAASVPGDAEPEATSTSESMSTPEMTSTPEPTVDIAGCTLGATFQADITIPDNTPLEAEQPFIKTWRVRNTGTCAWGPGYRLTFIDGEQMGGPTSMSVPYTPPGESAEISVELVVPPEEGTHRGIWQVCVNESECFGDRLSVVISSHLPPTPEPTSTPAPPMHVEVLIVSPHTDYDGDLWLYGEVENQGTTPVKQIEVMATLYDQDGAVLALDTAYVCTPLQGSLWYTGVLYPGERAPFKMLFESPGNWQTWKISLEYKEATSSDMSTHYQDLRAFNDQGRAIDELLYNYRVSGEVENTGSSETGMVRIVTTLYDAEGNIVGVECIGLSERDPLPAGEVTPFAIDMYARGTVASYRLLIRSVRH